MKLYKLIRTLLIVMFSACLFENVVVAVAEDENESRHYLGELVYAGTSDGYSKKEKISEDDPHYGWELGDFYLSGFTRVTEDKIPIFLKDSDDRVKLSFVLRQDIDKLDGKEELSIASDNDGYDEEFGIKKANFGRGMLIIKHIDDEGKSEDPVLYQNYLDGVKKGADTEVELFEEGDYEVALDYEVSIDKEWYDYIKLWSQYSYDYRISFRFSVRNGNSMVYPFDVSTKSELTNTSITQNGFYLDFAKSKYLDVNIKKEVINDGANGLVPDTRFNKPAREGEQYTDEGVYTITAKNRYTEQVTEKKIYVGDNSILKAYVTTQLPIEEIQKQLADGATINEDGTIEYTSVHKNRSGEDAIKPSNRGFRGNEENAIEDFIGENKSLLVVINVWALALIAIIVSLINKKRK